MRLLAGRYLLTEQLGEGAMGSVWRAFDLHQRRYVAAKVLGRFDAGLLLRFVREQSVRVLHPHVLTPTGWAADDDLVVFTMDVVRGGSLEQLIAERGLLPEGYVAVLLDQLLQALDAVHAAGLVHRDVKPANVLLEPGERPHLRLGDFGVAVPVDGVRLTRVPGLVGTEGFVAPEARDGSVDPRHDLYAAGQVVRAAVGTPDALAPVVQALTAPLESRPRDAQEALRLLRSRPMPGLERVDVPLRHPDPPAPALGRRAQAVALSCFGAALVLCAIALRLVA